MRAKSAGRPGAPSLRETTRVEAFSDGVLAIAITLLVLELRAPASAGRFAAELGDRWPAYLAYLASFVFIGVIWVSHHQLFSRVRLVDGGLLWANLALLATSSLLPFPTAVLGESFRIGERADQQVAVALYAAVAASSALCWLLLFHHLARHPQLLQDPGDGAFFARERRRASLGIGIYAVAAGAVLVSPLVGLVVCAVLPAFWAATSNGAPGADPAFPVASSPGR